jgi:hypothetical protein
VEKRFCKIYEKPYQSEDESPGQQFMINGILGIINICGYNFIAGITEKQYIARLDGANIYMVKRIELIPFINNFNSQI